MKNKSLPTAQSTELSTGASKIIDLIILDLLSNDYEENSENLRFKINRLILAYLQQGNLTASGTLTTISLSTDKLKEILIEDLGVDQISDETLGHTVNTFAQALYFRVFMTYYYPALESIDRSLLQKRAIKIFNIFYTKSITTFTQICSTFIENFKSNRINGTELLEKKALMRYNLDKLLSAMENFKLRHLKLITGDLNEEM